MNEEDSMERITVLVRGRTVEVTEQLFEQGRYSQCPVT